MVTKNGSGRLSAPVLDREAVAVLKSKFHAQNFVLVVLLFVVLLVMPTVPGFKGWMAGQATLVIVYILAAQGVSILTGYTGLASVGHGGFLAIGAYTAALLTRYWGADLIVSVMAATAMAGLIGMLMGLVFLRLAGPFMAIGTLGFAFFVGTIVNNVPFFEGRSGISVPPNKVLGIVVGDVGFYYVSVVALAVVTLFNSCKPAVVGDKLQIDVKADGQLVAGFALTVDASLAKAEAGGQTELFNIRDMSWLDPSTAQWVSLDRCKAAADQSAAGCPYPGKSPAAAWMYARHGSLRDPPQGRLPKRMR